jgi:hypothetical protein
VIGGFDKAEFKNTDGSSEILKFTELILLNDKAFDVSRLTFV